MSAKILIVDDELNVRLVYHSALESEGYQIFEAASGGQALAQCMARSHDAAILDLRMPDIDGLELLCKMHELKIYTPAVIITAYPDVPNSANAMKLGAIDFLKKPILPDQLRGIVKDILTRHAPKTDEEEKGAQRDFDYYLRRAKRAINMRDFVAAKKDVIKALGIDSKSSQALNLAGVMLEMREEYEEAKRYYSKAIKIDKNFEPARQNMKRIFELFGFGPDKEPSDKES